MRLRILAGAVAAIMSGYAAVPPAKAAMCLVPLPEEIYIAGVIVQRSHRDNAVLIETPKIGDCDAQRVIVALPESDRDDNCQIGNILEANGYLRREAGAPYISLAQARNIVCSERRR